MRILAIRRPTKRDMRQNEWATQIQLLVIPCLVIPCLGLLDLLQVLARRCRPGNPKKGIGHQLRLWLEEDVENPAPDDRATGDISE